MSGDAHRPYRRPRCSRSSEQVSNELHRVTHHVIENASTLERALPEPRHVRSAVLFGGARQIRAPRERGTSCPDELLPACDLRRKELILEVAGVESNARRESRNFFCLGDVAGEWFLAREPAKRSSAVGNRGDDLFHVGDARLVRAA